MIVAIGEHPSLPATQARRVLQERLYNGPADPATMVARSDSDLVDKHLGRLVRMDIVDAGRESDDLTLIDGYRDMVATVPKELRDKSWIDGATFLRTTSSLGPSILISGIRSWRRSSWRRRTDTRSRSSRPPNDSRW